MLDEQIIYKRRVMLKYILYFLLSLIVFVLVKRLILKANVDKFIMICKIVKDIALIFSVTCFFSEVILVINNSYQSLRSRLKTYISELSALVVLIYIFTLDIFENKLWIDIVLVVIFSFGMVIRDNGYLNRQCVIGLSLIAQDILSQYTEKYDKILKNVEMVNEKEGILMEKRIENAEKASDVKKAERDRRIHVVSNKLNPEIYDFPREPASENYIGIVGLLVGKDTIVNYERCVARYGRTLEKAYKKEERWNRNLKAYEDSIDNAMRYIEGPEEDKIFEEITGISINRTEKARKSYNILKRKTFERKTKKY